MGRAAAVPEALGRYELLVELARGGMAQLFLGRLNGVGGFAKVVAIKRILPHLAEDKQFVEMFLDEGRIAAHLSHPNVCQVYELGEADGELFLAMEYLDGVDWEHLAEAVPREEMLPLATGVIAQACAGLHYAHTLRDATGADTPVIHRDVSPQNLFVTVDGVCKVLDFGVSKMHGTGAATGKKTRTGVVKGKLPYMSPEQIRGETVDARTDVFALGVVLWEALSGVQLFDRSTDFLIWKAISEEPIPPLPAGTPPEVEAVVMQALERDPDKRFASARALANALREVARPLDAAQIADVVRARCAERLAKRRSEVGTALATAPMDSANSLSITAQHERADDEAHHPGSTVSLRPAQRDSLRDYVRPSKRDFDERAFVETAVQEPPPKPPRTPRWRYMALGAVAASAVSIAIILTTNPNETAPSATPTPAAPPDAAPPDAMTLAGVDAGARRADAHVDPAPPEIAPSRQAPPPDLDFLKRPPPPPPSQPGTAKPEMGMFSISSQPYASIYIDGSYAGDTPMFRYQLAPGHHTVRAVNSVTKLTHDYAIEIQAGSEINEGTIGW